ncbi:thioredoxin-like protein [Xylariaceae sp. FL1272]|nr:thioredoxin-like protein [Xylariaceae sp. FL1272]
MSTHFIRSAAIRRSAFSLPPVCRSYIIRQFASTSRNMGVHNIETKAAFDEAIKANKIVLLDCFATWCGPCKAIAPKLVEYSNQDEYKDIYFAKIDVDDLPEVAAELQITAMPTFKVFKDGKEVDALVGASPPALVNLLQKAL